MATRRSKSKWLIPRMYRKVVVTSSRNENVTIQATTANAAAMKQGKKYGNVFMKLESPKKSGKRSAGFEKKPPITGLKYTYEVILPINRVGTHAKAAPAAHVIGRYEYACEILVESVMSASMPLMTPMFPSSAPLRHRLCRK
jgi:hypothetical protein